MVLVAIVVGLVLFEYLVITWKCGQARGRLGVAAPSTTGNAEFERRFRVQQNTVEQLVIFLPATYLFATFVNAPIAAGLGLVFLLGRADQSKSVSQPLPSRKISREAPRDSVPSQRKVATVTPSPPSSWDAEP